MSGLRRQLFPGHRTRRRQPGFTLAEILMAMMVSGLILSAVVSLTWALGSFNDEGSGMVALSTHGRFAMTLIGRDIRAARVATVTSTGALVLWMGDLDEDGKSEMSEFVVYSKRDRGDTLCRLGFEKDLEADVVSEEISSELVATLFDMSMLVMDAEVKGLNPVTEDVAQHIEAVSFSPDQPAPDTLLVEYVLRLSQKQNRVQDTGRDVALNLYGAATMRTPGAEAGVLNQLPEDETPPDDEDETPDEPGDDEADEDDEDDEKDKKDKKDKGGKGK